MEKQVYLLSQTIFNIFIIFDIYLSIKLVHSYLEIFDISLAWLYKYDQLPSHNIINVVYFDFFIPSMSSMKRFLGLVTMHMHKFIL